MDFNIDEAILKALQKKAEALKLRIEYDAMVDGLPIKLGEPTVTKESITFDLGGMNDYEKNLVREMYSPNARKR